MPAGASIDLEGVGIQISGQKIVSDISLSIAAGEFVCLLGPSGCGKSTLLNAIAGFIPVEGRLRVGGREIRGPGIDRGVVFQNSDALFPWLTALENVEYGPRIRGVDKTERRKAARHYLELVGLGHAIDKFPAELSGGMRQRLQIARVLVNEPSVILMDEPFGALDAQTREVMQHELDRIWRATRSTIVFVTHDIGEAILLADRVFTMTTGPAARIKAIVSIDLPHPRDETDPGAIAIHRELRDDIGEEVSKVLRQQGLREKTA
ncbi:ABC transporter ATP-binding protein [Chelatococcus asaccharovorans]|uniref:NitT/TauT family transport system ATP-binding protein n=1 Tax=Chelatococcus asaccharovorans TaxID=28210 RepID=A0A2V3TY00_9HYPH|nr:ABC transporter ATP-binding protein [Chelatococcus asaccharovorans]MBS7706781.1 ABC transporter ATP-binding protein [Chelatococcus asaccharovorans]PXW54074.1 NitT/TauT family transport system ATP-binding protein [Chelatococcus asaccharovorans]